MLCKREQQEHALLPSELLQAVTRVDVVMGTTIPEEVSALLCNLPRGLIVYACMRAWSIYYLSVNKAEYF